MSGDLFFLLTRDHVILGQFDTLSEAREKLHKLNAAQYVARLDGVVLAYMSREGQSWRAIHKVSPETRKALAVYANLNPDQGPESVREPEELQDVLYPPAEDRDSAEAAFES